MTPIRHGTIGGYTNARCRCDRCTEAHSRTWREWSERIRAERRQPPSHGTEYAYNLFRCRCAECKAAKAVATRRRRKCGAAAEP